MSCEYSNDDNISEEDSKEVIMTLNEDELHFSDLDNVEFEEVDTDALEKSENDKDYVSLNTLKTSSRKRTRNFTNFEANLLCSLMEEYHDILNTKRCDFNTNNLKHQAWKEITEKFNSNTIEEYRTTLQLRTFQENLKKKRKRLYKEALQQTKEFSSSDNIESCSFEKRLTNDNIGNRSLDTHILERRLTSDTPNSVKKHVPFMNYYQRLKIELTEREIDKVKSASEQQRKLFLLQEEKLKLEIEEIKQRLNNE